MILPEGQVKEKKYCFFIQYDRLYVLTVFRERGVHERHCFGNHGYAGFCLFGLRRDRMLSFSDRLNDRWRKNLAVVCRQVISSRR